jgi:hypothetical protein
MFLVFQKIHIKRSPNAMNFFNDFSERKETKEASGDYQKTHRGPTSHLGAARGVAAPW